MALSLTNTHVSPRRISLFAAEGDNTHFPISTYSTMPLSLVHALTRKNLQMTKHPAKPSLPNTSRRQNKQDLQDLQTSDLRPPELRPPNLEVFLTCEQGDYATSKPSLGRAKQIHRRRVLYPRISCAWPSQQSATKIPRLVCAITRPDYDNSKALMAVFGRSLPDTSCGPVMEIQDH